MVTAWDNAQASPEFKKGTLIRDAEIEDTLRSYIKPIFRVAGLQETALNIHIIVDPSINAAATAEHRIFVQTGLIAASPDVGQILGVLAHETGHIACGHVVATSQQMEGASLGALASMVLGAGVAVLGAPNAGMAIMTGGVTFAERSFLRHSRTQESAADQAAGKYLNALGWSSEPLATFMEKLAQKELVSATVQDPYLSTHPQSRDRVEILRHHAQKSPHRGKPYPVAFQKSYALMRAKVIAYMDRPATVLTKFPGDDLADRYARAIAYHRLGDLGKVKPLLESLTTEEPKNPYFWELRGDVYYDRGNVAAARQAYEKATSFSKNPLLKVSVAKTLLAEEGEADVDRAAALLTTVVHQDAQDAFAWHLLAKARGKQNRMVEMSLALAEHHLIVGDFRECLLQIDRARSFLKRESLKNAGALKMRLNDLERDAREQRDAA